MPQDGQPKIGAGASADPGRPRSLRRYVGSALRAADSLARVLGGGGGSERWTVTERRRLFFTTKPDPSRCLARCSVVISAMNSSARCVRLRPLKRRAKERRLFPLLTLSRHLFGD